MSPEIRITLQSPWYFVFDFFIILSVAFLVILNSANTSTFSDRLDMPLSSFA